MKSRIMRTIFYGAEMGRGLKIVSTSHKAALCAVLRKQGCILNLFALTFKCINRFRRP